MEIDVPPPTSPLHSTSMDYDDSSYPEDHQPAPAAPPLPPTSHEESVDQPPRPRRVRLRFVQDQLPEQLPTLDEAEEPSVVRRVTLWLRDRLKTAANSMGLWREYLHRPSFEPDSFVPTEDLSQLSQPQYDDLLHQTTADYDRHRPLHPNKTWSLLFGWQNNGNVSKSNLEMDKLTKEVFNHPDFDLTEARKFNASRVAEEADKEDVKSSLLDRFREVPLRIRVPSGSADVPPKTFRIPGFHYRSLTSLIRSAFAHPLAAQFHLSPYRLFHTADEKTQRVYSELYDSDAFIAEHDRVQRAPNPPEDPNCKREKAVAALMFWSDSTHLANFGTAQLWPIYMFMGNLSKYIRAMPNSGACQHVAYIPQLPDSFQDQLKQWHTQWSKPSHRKEVLSHCRRELMHAAWRILLDDDFLHAYKYGMVVKCADGVERRIYPRIFTYSADYPEKVLLATIRDKGSCPCPRCLVPKSDLDSMGLFQDMKRRITKARKYLAGKVELARKWIYDEGYGIKSKAVERLLSETSSVPTINVFMDRLGPDFDLGQMLVPDFMHEFELGVWKDLFTHLIRILYAAKPDGSLVTELDSRFRQISAFGSNTIRRFATNTSEMKKLAARDFEDILQCCIPVFDGLLEDKDHDRQLMRLLYRTAEIHAFAKMRLHTEDTLSHLEHLTKEFGRHLRAFRDDVCSHYATTETPKEAARRRRTEARNSEGATNVSLKPKTLNLSTYKFHALGDYVRFIRLFGGTDSYSTQPGELAHRLVKRLYGLTNKRKVAGQIAKRVRRIERVREAREIRLREASLLNVVRRDSVRRTLQQEDGLERDLHHYMSHRENKPISISKILRENQNDPAFEYFMPKLKDHLLGRLLGRGFDGDEHDEFTDEDRNTVFIRNDKLYEPKNPPRRYGPFAGRQS
ncbi:hypothetical protein CC2G_000019 [Coprinopsis cinerea AmutBmut pab1-1]|nr:hypothetical protein CC2G_000019 [Coprinopsis cinerea AmutBmut pab1-1]